VATKRTEESDNSLTAGFSAATLPHTVAAEKPAKDDDRISQFWRVFGGTLLSIAALVAVTMYNGMNTSISDLRNEITRLNEAKADAAKKDDVGALRTQMATIASYRAEIDSLKERASKYRNEIEEAKKDTQARLDGVKKERDADLDVLRKEHAAELKLAKEELAKLRMDVDRNQTADHERRDQRTAQMKAVDETLKDLQKALLESREKIARLEGLQSQGIPPKPAKATDPVER
jgi:chromosome segregation ATPase